MLYVDRKVDTDSISSSQLRYHCEILGIATMDSLETVGIIALVALIFLGPSIFIAILGWRFTRTIENDYLRILIRSLILAFAFTPSLYGHAGPMFASWVIFLAHGPDRFFYGIGPIAVTWFIGGGIAVIIRWVKKRR